jgi:putative transposase
VAALIAARRADDGITYAVFCRALGVSRSWFYKCRDGKLPAQAARRVQLAAEVARLFALHKGKYGSPRITADLKDLGWRVSENTVAGLMREQGMAARRKRRRRGFTRPGKGRWRAPDLVKRDFPARGSTRSGTAAAPRSPPVRGSFTWPRSWTSPPAGCSGSPWVSTMMRSWLTAPW